VDSGLGAGLDRVLNHSTIFFPGKAIFWKNRIAFTSKWEETTSALVSRAKTAVQSSFTLAR